MTRVERLEAAYRAAVKLRKAAVKLTPIAKMWSVPEAAVTEFDQTIVTLKKDKENTHE